MAETSGVEVPSARSIGNQVEMTAWATGAGAVGLMASAAVGRFNIPPAFGLLATSVAVGSLIKGPAGDVPAAMLAYQAGQSLMQQYGGGILNTIAGG